MFAVFFCEYRIASVLTGEGYLLYSVLSAAKMLSVRMGSFVERPTHLNLGYFQNCFLGIFLMFPSSLKQDDIWKKLHVVYKNISGLSEC